MNRITFVFSKASDQCFRLLSEFNLTNFVFMRFNTLLSFNVTFGLCGFTMPNRTILLIENFLLAPLRKFLVEVAFVLDQVDLVNKSKLHVVVDMQKLECLANLHLEVIVCLFKFRDVHILKLRENSKFAVAALTFDICKNQLRTTSF